MKSLFIKLFSAVLALGVFTACEKDEERLLLNETAVPVATLSSQNIVLTRDRADADVLTINWAKPEYGFNAASTYTILIDKKGGDFSKAQTVTVGNALTKTFKAAELNTLLIALGLTPGAAADVDFRVQSTLGPTTRLSSVVSTVRATPYLDRLDLSTTWGVVGSATPNGWNGPDVPFFRQQGNASGDLVAYTTLTDGEIKFRQNNAWDVNLGGSAGKLVANGDNIKVTAGTYRITFNPTALTYKIEPFSLGVVGDATPNGWNGPDVPFVYDPSTDQWRAIVTLKAGDIKFRLNNAWDVNYGGSAGTLATGGDNIKVTPGTYLISLDLRGLKYTVEAYKPWGLVGDATPNGWNGPDVVLMPDFANEGLFRATNVPLKVGEVKFRQNNDWTVNFGGANGTLSAGGANIKVTTAGNYDVVLDLRNASAPKYTLTKK